LNVDGRVVVVTGAAGGLGRAYAELFAQRGAQLMLNDTASDGLNELATGLGAVPDTNTVATPEGGEAIVAHALDAFGRLDVLVNNAGIARPNYLDDLDWSDLSATLSVHLLGAFHLSKPAWRIFRAAGGGAIVNTTSAVGLFGQQRSSGYAAAKLGIVGMTRVLAIEGAGYGIRVNAIAPVASSPMAGPVYGALDPKLDPKLVAATVLALAHESCKLNGEVISAGGGRIARVIIGTSPGSFVPDLSVEDASQYLGSLPAEEHYLTPGSAMEEIDLIRVNHPGLTEPMRYPEPPR
jgi:NAD(P)-dependent dehydrogenase (short-subunit alcohol dehydrogenase family)